VQPPAGQQPNPQQGRPNQQAPQSAQQGRPPQNTRPPQQKPRQLSDLPDSAAPPPDDYVEPTEPDLQSEYEPGGWAVAAIPGAEKTAAAAEAAVEKAKVQKPALVIDPTQPAVRPFGKGPEALAPGEKQRYGESVVREILGASFIEEEAVAPRVIPMRND